MIELGWDKKLETGIELIDNQHRELFLRFDLFMRACDQGSGLEEIEKLLIFLESYAREHFRDEEALMVKHNYPGYSPQRIHHRKATQCIFGMKQMLDNRQQDQLILLKEANLTVQEWMINHIYTMDMVFAKFLRRHSIQ